jgi:hypothetical protein
MRPPPGGRPAGPPPMLLPFQACPVSKPTALANPSESAGSCQRQADGPGPTCVSEAGNGSRPEGCTVPRPRARQRAGGAPRAHLAQAPQALWPQAAQHDHAVAHQRRPAAPGIWPQRLHLFAVRRSSPCCAGRCEPRCGRRPAKGHTERVKTLDGRLPCASAAHRSRGHRVAEQLRHAEAGTAVGA